MKINYSFVYLFIFSLYIGYVNYLLLFILALLLHELGHIIFIKLFKLKIKGINLSIYGGELKLDDYQFFRLSNLKKILIYCSGVIVNILFYIMFKGTLFSKINLILTVFNLLPVFPLDGYNILLVFLNKKPSLLNNITIIFIIFLIIISVYYNSIGLVILVLIILYKNINHLIHKDEQYLLKIIKNMI